MPWYLASGCETLKEGSGKKIEIDGSQLGIFRLDGLFWAVQDFCPHRGGSLGHGELDEYGWLACPLHAWFFNIKTGQSSTNPIMSIKTFPCETRDNQVWVNLPDILERKIP